MIRLKCLKYWMLNLDAAKPHFRMHVGEKLDFQIYIFSRFRK